MDRVWFTQICLMFILVLILPFQFAVGYDWFIYASPIINLGYEASFMRNVTGFSSALSLMFVFFVSIPALYANYVMHSRPASESVARPIVFAVTMSQPLIVS